MKEQCGIVASRPDFTAAADLFRVFRHVYDTLAPPIHRGPMSQLTPQAAGRSLPLS